VSRPKYIYTQRTIIQRVSMRCSLAKQLSTLYLLTPMDRATLLNAKSTVSHCYRVQLPGNEFRLIANCYSDQEMSVITTYLNDRPNGQTPLGQFVV